MPQPAGSETRRAGASAGWLGGARVQRVRNARRQRREARRAREPEAVCEHGRMLKQTLDGQSSAHLLRDLSRRARLKHGAHPIFTNPHPQAQCVLLLPPFLVYVASARSESLHLPDSSGSRTAGFAPHFPYDISSATSLDPRWCARANLCAGVCGSVGAAVDSVCARGRGWRRARRN